MNSLHSHSVVSLFYVSPSVRESRFWNPGNLHLWNLESGNILLMESGIPGFGIWNTAQGIWIPLTIGIQNPSSTDKYQNPVPGIRNPQCGIQNPRLSWIPFLGAICACQRKTLPAPPPPPSVSSSPLCLFLQSSCRKNKPHQRVVIGNFLTFLITT